MGDAVALMASLVLDDGRRWGDAATAWQVDDARAVLDADGPRMHYVGRPRGGAKTADASGIGTALLLAEAPPRSRSYCFASDRDQAQLVMDSLGGFVQRTPGLAGALEVETWRVRSRESGASLVVMASDSASAYGLRGWFLHVDEFCQWASTAGPRALWQAVVSGLPKVADARLLVTSTAGDPSSWQAKVVASARRSRRWRVSETAGPVPWLSPEDLEEQRGLLPESAFARLHLNQWVDHDDRLVRADDLDAACRLSDFPREPAPGRIYAAGLDLGVKRDATALAVCSVEREELAEPTVSLDRLMVWQGTRGEPVDLGEVEAAAHKLCVDFGCPLVFDPWQAVAMMQRLRSRGVDVVEHAFTQTSNARRALNLHRLLREHRLALPVDDEGLRSELGRVQLVERSPGVYRVDHVEGEFDDRVQAVGLAALHLIENAPAVEDLSWLVDHSPVGLHRVSPWRVG